MIDRREMSNSGTSPSSSRNNPPLHLSLSAERQEVRRRSEGRIRNAFNIILPLEHKATKQVERGGYCVKAASGPASGLGEVCTS